MKNENFEKAVTLKEELRTLNNIKEILLPENKRMFVKISSKKDGISYEKDQTFQSVKNPANSFDEFINDEFEIFVQRILLRLEKEIKQREKEFEAL
ncbi:MAG: hypothetical protein WC554_01895 [Clostridia bacterium]